MKTLRLLPSAFALLSGFVPQPLPARDHASFPDGPNAYGDQVSLRRAQDMNTPENATASKSAIREMTLSSGYVSNFRDPNAKTAKRVLSGGNEVVPLPTLIKDPATGRSKWTDASGKVRKVTGTEVVPLDSLTKNPASGEWTDPTGRILKVLATNVAYNFAVVSRAFSSAEALTNVIEAKLATPDVWLHSPSISTPKADAVRESQGESSAPGQSLRPANEGVEVQFVPSDEQIRAALLDEPTTSLWEPNARVPRAPVLPKFIEMGSDQGAPEIIFPLLRKSVLHRYDRLDAPRISTPRSDRVRQSLGEGAQAGFERINPPRPIAPHVKTMGFLGATVEAAAGFPGEVIDEVIVPVPSEIFLVLDKLGKPDWKGQLRSGKQPSLSNRIDVSLLLGSVVAEGFVAVQAEDRGAVEQIGKDVLRLSESLGLKETVLPHTNSILEASKHNHWEIVRVELDKTQKTVRDTMEQRRDAELAQCVSLGGWLRGTEAVTDLINKNYTSDSAELLNQPDIVRHFQKELKKLATRNQKLKNMLAGLETIAGVIGTGDEPPNAGGVQAIHTTTAKLVKSIATPSK